MIKIGKSIRRNTFKYITKAIGYEKSTKIVYLFKMKKKLDLNNPTLFNEKIQWLKLNWQKRSIVECADKYQVRKYVADKGYDKILNELYQVCDNPDEILWDQLPNEFVIKTTNSCGTNIIVNNKEELDIKQVKATLIRWLKEDYGLLHLEPHYSYIKPKIIIEKYIKPKNDSLQDYKIFCFNGKPEFVLYIDERNLNNGTKKRGYYSLNWEYLDVTKLPIEDQSRNVVKPYKLEEMITIAEKLSEGFPFVRVDLYNEYEDVIFGELTFTPHGGMAPYYKADFDKKIGDMLKLPNKILKGYTQ